MWRRSGVSELQQGIGSGSQAPPQIHQQTEMHQYTVQIQDMTRSTNEKPTADRKQKEKAKYNQSQK